MFNKNQTLIVILLLLAAAVSTILSSNSSLAAQHARNTPQNTRTILQPDQQIGFIPGQVRSIVVEQGIALATAGSQLVILNTTDVSHPRIISNLYLQDPIQQPIVVRERLVYIATNMCSAIGIGGGLPQTCYGTLNIVNISDPTAPTIVGQLHHNQAITGPALFGNYALIADSQSANSDTHSGAHVVDISNPEQPKDVNFFQLYPYASSKVFGIYQPLKQAYAFIKDENYLHIYDMSIPTAPTLVSKTIMPGYDYSFLSFYEDPLTHKLYAYTSYHDFLTDEKGIVIYDMSDMHNPTQIHNITLNAWAYYISIFGERLLVGKIDHETSQEMLTIFDITKPDSPVERNTLALSSVTNVVGTDPQHALVGTRDGIQVLDMSNPDMPLLGLNIKTVKEDILLRDTRLYINLPTREIDVVDIFNPAVPHFIGKLSGDRVAVHNQHAITYRYNSDNTTELLMYNIENSPPSMLGTLMLPFTYAQSVGLEIGGPSFNFVYLASSENIAFSRDFGYVKADLSVIDVSNPSSIAIVGNLHIPETITTISLNYPYIYVATEGNSLGKLYVVDVTQPSNPTILGWVALPSSAADLAIDGTRIYAATSYKGLQIIDVSNPTQPQILGAYMPDDLRTIEQVNTVHGIVYMLPWKNQQTGPIYVLDLSNIATPITLNQYPGSCLEIQGNLFAICRNGISLFYNAASSGQVRDSMGLPVSGTTISAVDGSGTKLATSGLTGGYHLPTAAPALQASPAAGITAQLPGYTSWPSERSMQEAAMGQAHFTLLAQPSTVTLTPAAGGIATFTDLNGATTTVTVAPATSPFTTSMHLTPTLGTDLHQLAFAGHAFELSLDHPPQTQPFATLTLIYRPNEVRVVSDLSQLTVRYWDGTDWQDASTTCTPASKYTRDPEASILSIPLCQPGRYALFGPTNRSFAPLVMR